MYNNQYYFHYLPSTPHWIRNSVPKIFFTPHFFSDFAFRIFMLSHSAILPLFWHEFRNFAGAKIVLFHSSAKGVGGLITIYVTARAHARHQTKYFLFYFADK